MSRKLSIKVVINGGFCGALLWGMALPLASAQTDPGQLEALGRLQDQQDSQRVAQQRAQAQAAQQAQMAEMRAARARAVARERRASALAEERRAKEADDRAYLHALREIDIQKQKAQLQLEEAKAKHAEDYVQAELNQKHADTDAVSAKSDATRTLANGEQHLMEDSGKAEKMKQRHWWEFYKD